MRSVLKRAAFLLIALILVALPFEGILGATLGEEDIFLSKHGVYYQIFVRAFADGNGDGLGDLRGIIDRLDYLEELGISGIWLTPIHPSPSYHKYDVTDFYDIDREIGTLAVEFRDHLTRIKPDVYLAAEVWDNFNVVAPYYGGFDSCFNFDLANLIILSARGGTDFGLARVTQRSFNRYREHSEWVLDAPFLTNHDQDRVMSVLNDVNQAKMAASVYLTLPGNPFVYYGEEIGMKGSGIDENKREPFKWYPLNGPGQTTWSASNNNTGSWQPSVQEQQKDPNSLWNHDRNLIHLREGNLPLKVGGTLQSIQGTSRLLAS